MRDTASSLLNHCRARGVHVQLFFNEREAIGMVPIAMRRLAFLFPRNPCMVLRRNHEIEHMNLQLWHSFLDFSFGEIAQHGRKEG
jgi:hypothetical protein